jgi:multimeric flavodoxin WrbA
MLSTIALFASSRRHGNTGQVIDAVATALGVEVVDLSALRIGPFDYAHGNRDDDFEPLMQRVLRHEQIVFAAPVYWYSAPPPMKTLLDRINDLLVVPDLRSQGRKLRGKRAYVVATSGIDVIAPAFIGMFTESFAYLGMQYRGVLHLNCDGGYVPGTGAAELDRFTAALREAQ